MDSEEIGNYTYLRTFDNFGIFVCEFMLFTALLSTSNLKSIMDIYESATAFPSKSGRTT